MLTANMILLRVKLGALAAAAMISFAATAEASNNVVFALDGNLVWNRPGTSPVTDPAWGGFGRFSYANVVGLSPSGRYEGFTIAESGVDGSGVAIDYYVNEVGSPKDPLNGTINPASASFWPILDRGTFGTSFDASQYTAELVFKPLAGNAATTLQLVLDQFDGFDAGGARHGQQVGYLFPDLINYYNNPNTVKDADGFATIRNNAGNFVAETGYVPGTLADNNAIFHSQSRLGDTEGIACCMQPDPPLSANGGEGPHGVDFDAFAGGGTLPVPKGVMQFTLQTTGFGMANPVDAWEIKQVLVRKVTPDPVEVVRLDARTGFSSRFGPAFALEQDALQNPINIGGVDYYPGNTDQVQRFNQTGFTNLVINTDDASPTGNSGLFVFQPADFTVFDGSTANVEIRAKLTAPLSGSHATSIRLAAKDKDGNDDAAAQGGDEYIFDLPLNQLNTTTMTTISIPLNSFTRVGAFEFQNDGDAQLADFNLYMFGLTIQQNAGLVDMEIEYMRILQQAPPADDADFDNDLDVDGNDFLIWQRGLGSPGGNSSGDANGDGQVNGQDLTIWRNEFGQPQLAAAIGSVPEPAAAALCAMALVATATSGRRRRR